jgi:hypothetical protein
LVYRSRGIAVAEGVRQTHAGGERTCNVAASFRMLAADFLQLASMRGSW